MALVASVSRIYDYKDEMLYKNKPALKLGQDARTLPTYTIPEAAEYLAIDPWTLLSWYSKREPVLKPSGWYGEAEAFALLTFQDIEEAYKVHMLRTKYGYSMQYIQKALADARKESKSDHPLIHPKFNFYAYDRLAMEIPKRGRKTTTMIPLAAKDRAYFIGEVVKAWGKRIVTDRKGKTKQIFPWRFAAKDEESRPVSIQPDVLSGRLVVTGTRIPVRVLASRIRAGETPEALAKDYGINSDLVRKALVHFEQKTH
jgi:uncharacterized protein (DUF433 family)